MLLQDTGGAAISSLGIIPAMREARRHATRIVRYFAERPASMNAMLAEAVTVLAEPLPRNAGGKVLKRELREKLVP
jgi:hypothetical protein